MINFIKKDFKRVWNLLKAQTNGKIPGWAIVVYYCLLAPIGFLLLPIVEIFCRIRYGIWIPLK